MARISIYQMSIGQSENGEIGYVFPNEQKDAGVQSIIFAVPIVISFPHHASEFEDYLYSNTFYFPFALGDQYMELEAKIDFPQMIFSVPSTDFNIAFDISFSDGDYSNSFLRYYSYSPRNTRRQYQYVGSEPILKNHGFINLLPYDLLEMDELYVKHKGVFVGRTPAFESPEARELIA